MLIKANPWSEIPDCVLEINNALPKQVAKRVETSTTSEKKCCLDDCLHIGQFILFQNSTNDRKGDFNLLITSLTSYTYLT